MPDLEEAAAIGAVIASILNTDRGPLLDQAEGAWLRAALREGVGLQGA